MSTPVELTADQRSSLNRAFVIGQALGRKFEPSDITGDVAADLMQAARVYAMSYEGTFGYMREMRAAASTFGRLSIGQAKGVLNCLMADGRRRREAAARAKAEPAATAAQAAPEAAPVGRPLAEIPNGTYTVVLPGGDYVTIRLSDWEDYQDRSTGRKIAGVRAVKYLAGPDNSTDFVYFGKLMPNGRAFLKNGFDRQRAALDVVLRGDHLAELGMAYALRSSRCFRCNRKLTVPASIHSGLGPDCAEVVGAAYGPPPAPAVAEAMQAEPEPLVSEPEPVVPAAVVDPVAAAWEAHVPYGAPGREAWVRAALELEDYEEPAA